MDDLMLLAKNDAEIKVFGADQGIFSDKFACSYILRNVIQWPWRGERGYNLMASHCSMRHSWYHNDSEWAGKLKYNGVLDVDLITWKAGKMFEIWAEQWEQGDGNHHRVCLWWGRPTVQVLLNGLREIYMSLNEWQKDKKTAESWGKLIKGCETNILDILCEGLFSLLGHGFIVTQSS